MTFSQKADEEPLEVSGSFSSDDEARVYFLKGDHLLFCESLILELGFLGIFGLHIFSH